MLNDIQDLRQLLVEIQESGEPMSMEAYEDRKLDWETAFALIDDIIQQITQHESDAIKERNG